MLVERGFLSFLLPEESLPACSEQVVRLSFLGVREFQIGQSGIKGRIHEVKDGKRRPHTCDPDLLNRGARVRGKVRSVSVGHVYEALCQNGSFCQRVEL